MKLSEQVKKNIEGLNNLLNSIGIDHLPNCGCWGECDCKHPHTKIKDKLIQSQLSLIDSMVERLEESKITIKFKPVTEKYKCAEDRKWAYNQALQDQIDYLLEERSKIERI